MTFSSDWIIEDLRKSGLSDAIIAEMKIKEVPAGPDGVKLLKETLGFKQREGQSILQATPAYVIPYAADANFRRIKLQHPLDDAKYLSPSKAHNEDTQHLYYLPDEEKKLGNASYDLIITEGEKKAAKLTQELRAGNLNAVAVGVAGVTMWRQCPEWSDIPRANRNVYICFDSDFHTKPDVSYQMLCLWLWLRHKKANAKVILFEGGKGIDDALAAIPNPQSYLQQIITNAPANIFGVLSQCHVELHYLKLVDAVVSCSYSVPDCKALWNEFKLKKAFTISATDFKDLVKQAYRKNQATKEHTDTTTPKRDNTIPNGKLYDNAIYEQDGKTYLVKSKRSDEADYFPLEIAAFVATVTKEIKDDDDNISWAVTIKSKSKTTTLDIDGESLLNVTTFRNAIAKRGCFLYHVTDIPTHNLFIQFIMEKEKIMSQLKTKYLGKVADGTFLAHNVLVREARVVPIADSDIIPPRSERGHEVNIHNFSITDEAQDLLEAFVENMKTILGKQTWKALGFAVATLFNDSIFSQFDFFPLLFLYGKHGTGKTAMAYWLQSLFGCHHQQHFNIGSTQKSYQRAGAKYKSCPVVLNEYQANERNNTTLCAIADQQGYSRAEKSNDLDILQGEINASFMVCSTQDIIGAKAEDAKSRCIEINTNDCHTDNEAFNWLQGHKDQFSCFIPIILANLNGKNLAIKIKQNLAQVRQQIKGKYEERILTSMTILAVCYEEFSGLLLGDQCDRVAFSEIANAVCDQTQETAKSDLGMTFLKIAVALASNNKIEPAIARFNPPLTQSSKDDKEPGPTATHEFLFSLTGILPFVRQQGKSSEIGISDEKTIAKSLEALGAEKKVGCRMLAGSSKTVWVIKSQLLALATD